jgi:hypothetical protein
MHERTAIVSGIWFAQFQIPAGWHVVGHDPMTDRVKLVTNDPDAFALERLEEEDCGPSRRHPEQLADYAPEWAKPLDARRAW